ncbi:MAG: threonine-phosphate decarboxylase [Rhodobiaceae bacterium]|nr:MAG: threonine-phosphate decarboxylase [Rhodobiaceae bacterium]
MNGLSHGGDLQAFASRNPDAPRPSIDLSTGINPVPYPATLDMQAMARLPGRADYDSCVAAFAAYAEADRDLVRVIPGSQSAISVLPTLFKKCHVAILAPTYGEHELCWRQAGHKVTRATASQIVDMDADIIVLTNPNNPDGHVFGCDALRALQKRQAHKNGWLVVDEAFVDAAPGQSVAKHVSDGGLIVLRSFGKFFGLAGLRLGFLIAPASIGKRYGDLLGPWSVATPALVIGAQAYADGSWIAETRQRLMSDVVQLRDLMAERVEGMVVGTALFQLFTTPNAQHLASHLADHGIFVRCFTDQPDWLRMGLPGNDLEWHRLQNALESWEK